MKKYLISFFTALSFFAFAQTTSFKEEKIKELNDLAFGYLATDLDSTYFLAQEAKKAAQQINYSNGFIDACFAEGAYHIYKGEFAKAKLAYLEAYANAKENKNIQMMAKIKGSIALAYQKEGNTDLAIESFKDALDLFKANKDSLEIGKTLNNIGWIYLEYEDYEASLTSFEEAMEYFKILNEEVLYYFAKLNIGNALSAQKRHKEALDAYFEADEFFLEEDTKERGQANIIGDRANIALGLGITYEEMGDFDKALFHYNRVIDFSKTTSLSVLAKAYVSKGVLYSKRNNLDSAEIQILKGIELSKSKGWQPSLLRLGYKNLLEVYKNKQAYPQAFAASEELAKLNEELFTKEKMKAVNQFKIQYQTEKKEQENSLLKEEKRNAQLKTYALVILLLLVGVIAFLLNRQKKAREKTNLQLQEKNREIIHRTKNNLTMLSIFMKQEARRIDNKQAKTAVQEAETRLQTIALIDEKFSQQDNNIINIDEYISKLTGYLKNTFTLKSDNIQLKVDVSNLALDAEYAAWLGLIVNELMTNSFKHAFINEDQPLIEIKLRKEADKQIAMMYRDNGIGLSNSLAIKNTSSFGQQLIRSLTEQMNGSIQTSNVNGLEYQFSFQIPNLI